MYDDSTLYHLRITSFNYFDLKAIVHLLHYSVFRLKVNLSGSLLVFLDLQHLPDFMDALE